VYDKAIKKRNELLAQKFNLNNDPEYKRLKIQVKDAFDEYKKKYLKLCDKCITKDWK
jgi:catalase (peroxidase I)|tara:strand:+ start:488 stop:658 length:171 start_codon:yes stop_codon:yes gene_type:complete